MTMEEEHKPEGEKQCMYQLSDPEFSTAGSFSQLWSGRIIASVMIK